MAKFKYSRKDDRFIKGISTGNKKLKNTKNVRFLIWNIPAKITCPYATEHCKGACYACKAERAYPTCLPCRVRHLDESKCEDFVERMIYTLETYGSGRAYENKQIVVRIHESGDFYNKEYANKWLEIARHFENTDSRFVFMAYTKSVRYFENEEIPTNMVVRFSVWDDTRAEELAIAEKMDLPIYTADTAEVVDRMVELGLAVKCECADCGECGKCWNRAYSRIIVVIH